MDRLTPKPGWFPISLHTANNKTFFNQTSNQTENTVVKDLTSVNFFKCQRVEYCTGAAIETPCDNHREGPLCSLCERGYRQELGSLRCTKCPQVTTAVGLSVFFVILVFLGLAAVFAWMFHSTRLETVTRAEQMEENQNFSTLSKRVTDMIGSIPAPQCSVV
eukprot:g38887.t1